jgi:hypothetical protein
MVNTKINATSYKLHSFELNSVVYQDSLGHTESVYDALQELDYCFLCYVHHWDSFHSFGEWVDCNEQESESSWRPGRIPMMSIPHIAKGEERLIDR